MNDGARRILTTNDLVSGYGKKRVLNGVGIEVSHNEIVAVIGHNGAGKSTLLKAIFGLLPLWSGRIELDGKAMAPPTPQNMLRERVAFVPQGNRVFGDLSVRENLELGGMTLANAKLLGERIERIYLLFPQLESRLRQRAGTLSGGEKQMLALANALVLSPRLLLLDEPSLGLSPPLASHALRHIQRICDELDVATLIVEQKVREVLGIANRVYVLRNGLVAYHGPSDDLKDVAKLRQIYF